MPIYRVACEQYLCLGGHRVGNSSTPCQQVVHSPVARFTCHLKWSHIRFSQCQLQPWNLVVSAGVHLWATNLRQHGFYDKHDRCCQKQFTIAQSLLATNDDVKLSRRKNCGLGLAMSIFDLPLSIVCTCTSQQSKLLHAAVQLFTSL